MKKEEIFELMRNNPIFHLATIVSKNPNVELCFNDFKKNVQVRVYGRLEEIEDNEFKDQICAHPSRAFLKPWRESGPLENFYSTFKVFKLKNGKAIIWTMETNFAPKVEISF